MWLQVQQALQQSLERVIFKVATLLPGVLALILALLLFMLLGWLLVAIVRVVLQAIGFDKRVDHWGLVSLSEISPTNTPTFLVTRIVFWATLLVGLLVGVEAFDASSSSGLSAYMIGYLSKVVAAIVLLLVGTVIARFLSTTVLIHAVNMNLQHARLLSVGVKWLVLVFTIAMILDHLEIGRDIVDLGFGILFGGIVLALSLAVGLGSRDLVSRSLKREPAKPPQDEEIVRHF